MSSVEVQSEILHPNLKNLVEVVSIAWDGEDNRERNIYNC